jgi:hypothetical protein
MGHNGGWSGRSLHGGAGSRLGPTDQLNGKGGHHKGTKKSGGNPKGGGPGAVGGPDLGHRGAWQHPISMGKAPRRG